jgi:hypothetical protein
MAYESMPASYFGMHVPDGPQQIGSRGWAAAPFIKWGMNPQNVGPRTIATSGLGESAIAYAQHQYALAQQAAATAAAAASQDNSWMSDPAKLAMIEAARAADSAQASAAGDGRAAAIQNAQNTSYTAAYNAFQSAFVPGTASLHLQSMPGVLAVPSFLSLSKKQWLMLGLGAAAVAAVGAFVVARG